MKDILNRNIEDYDLVVGKGSGRYVYGMSLGVWMGKSMVDSNGIRRSMSDVYLIENPTEKELAIKQDILNKIEEKKKIAEENKVNYIPYSKLVKGGIYKTHDGHRFLFLGKNKVDLYKAYDGYITSSKDYLWNLSVSKEGNCFMYVPYNLRDSMNSINEIDPLDLTDYYGNEIYIDIIKTSKKFTEFIRKIDLEDNFEMKRIITEEERRSHSPYYRNRSSIKIVFTAIDK